MGRGAGLADAGGEPDPGGSRPAGAQHLKFFDKVAGIFEGAAARSAGAKDPDAAGEVRYVGLLAEVFAAFRARDKGLPTRAARYVVSGEGPAVLLEVTYPASHMDVLGIAGLRGFAGLERSHNQALAGLLRDESFQEPETLHRLGQVMAATLQKPLYSYWYAGSARCPDWFRALMTASATCSKVLAGDHGRNPGLGIIGVERALAALALDGAGLTELLDYLCTAGGHSTVANPLRPRRIPGLGEFLANHPEEVAEAAAKLDAEARARLCVLLGLVDALAPNRNTVVGLAVAPAKSVREAAAHALAGSSSEALREALAHVFAAKSVEPKVHAVALLAQTLGAEARPLLEAQLANAPPKKLKDAIARNLAALGGTPNEERGEQGESSQNSDNDAQSYRAVDGTLVEIPPLSQVAQADTPFPEDLREPLRAAVEVYNTEHRTAQQNYPNARLKKVFLEPRTADDVIAAANGNSVKARKGLGFICRVLQGSACGNALQTILLDPRVTLRHLLRLYQFVDWPVGKLPQISEAYASTALAAIFRKRMLAEVEDIRALIALHGAIGCEREDLARDIFVHQAWELVSPARARFVWPYLIEQTALFEEALGVRPVPQNAGAMKISLGSAFAALELLPNVPQRLVPPLMRLALIGAKTQKRRTRDLIAGAPDLDASIAGLLDDGQAETRADAALWLAERNARDHVPRIRALLKKERSDKARASFLRALTALGDDIAPFVGETTLLAEAQAGLKKTGTKGLEWFPFQLLPAMRWADGTPVSPEIARWWVVLANKLKEPGGNPLFDVYFDRLAPDDPAKLGAVVLAAFIEYDTQRQPEALAIAWADKYVDARFASYAQYSWMKATRESVYAELKNEILSAYPNSAASNRGILALTTRIPGPEAPAKVRAYLKVHGGRTSQAKALLSCLAGNGSSEAIQVVLATANRAKQATVQEHAAALVREIADARGWTPDELADNTIPTAGLDEHAALELDCGEDRAYAAVLAANGKLELRTPLGKPAKALPAPRAGEDEARLNQAKRAFASAKKEVAQVLDIQTSRLYEAMCLERTWRVDDWERLLLGHPIVRTICRRLVWLALDEQNAVIASFRPLDDGTFTGPADERVDLAGVAALKLAHRALVADELAEAWTTHLADYEITPAFEQFSRPVLAATPDDAARERITERRGWMIEALKLRGAATKRGYQPGPAHDGGVFLEWVRRHPGAGLQVEIGFTGSMPGGENPPAALTELSFTTLRRGANEPIPLANVPRVLLSEALNDYREIADAGSGFDPDWQKKSEF